ncbi:phosphopantothenoylcysteine decarboxylase isoform X2 [Ambystoma mexicanum]
MEPEKPAQTATLPLPISHPGLPPAMPTTFRVLLGVTGSVAALKLPLLISGLQAFPGVEVRVVTTEHAKHFYSLQDILVPVYSDSDEWDVCFSISGYEWRDPEDSIAPAETQMWKQRTDPVLHIELRRWADVMVVAPLDANTMAKLSTGICDNLLTCVIRAWDLKKPLLFCPAMNTYMWQHPVTEQQVELLKGFGYTEVPCIFKKLVCGDEGRGAMAEVATIVEKVRLLIPETKATPQSGLQEAEQEHH